MKTIELTRGKIALVDDSDFDWVEKLSWRATRTCPTGIERWYALHTVGPSGETMYMHREIMIRLGFSPDTLFDHRDGDGLNNQRSNLRPCSATENVRNRRKEPGLSSRFKGVYWHIRDEKWIARLVNNRKSIYIGAFNDEESAGRAYDKKASVLFGEFAKLNFPTVLT